VIQPGLISQGKGAELAGLTRAGFLDALFHAKVPACQVTPEELAEELRLASKTGQGLRGPFLSGFA